MIDVNYIDTTSGAIKCFECDYILVLSLCINFTIIVVCLNKIESKNLVVWF